MGKASRQKKDGGTRDHTVPQMYLRHFAKHQARRQYVLQMRRIENPDRVIPAAPSKVGATTGFYWGTTLDDIPHHACEEFFSQLEGSADSVLKTILDNKEWALTPSWPLTREQRGALAWWMAAQILRTTRQRDRLTHVLPPAEENPELPEHIAKLAANNPHLDYIAGNVEALAAMLYDRPWGLGFSDMCLLTSDVPVVIWNRPDEDDQILAVAHSDVMLPLDPHRLLFLPSPAQQRADPHKRVDHRLHVKGGVGKVLVGIAWDVANQFVVHHPQHDPWKHWKPDGPRQPRPWAGESHPAPQYALEYPVIPWGLNIERRFTSEHP